MQSGPSIPSRKHLKRIPVWLPDHQRIVYFLTLCTADRQKLFVAPETVRIGIEGLQRAETRLEWKVWHLCIMPDHIHALVSPRSRRDQKLSNFVQRWKCSVTMMLHSRGISGNIWQDEFFDRLLRSDEKMSEKWEYIRENPVRAGLCAQPEDFPFSGTPDEIMTRIGEKH